MVEPPTTKKPIKNDMMEIATVRYRNVANVQQPPTSAVNTPPIMQHVRRTEPVKSSLISRSAFWSLSITQVYFDAFRKLLPCKPTCIIVPQQ